MLQGGQGPGIRESGGPKQISLNLEISSSGASQQIRMPVIPFQQQQSQQQEEVEQPQKAPHGGVPSPESPQVGPSGMVKQPYTMPRPP